MARDLEPNAETSDDDDTCTAGLFRFVGPFDGERMPDVSKLRGWWFTGFLENWRWTQTILTLQGIGPLEQGVCGGLPRAGSALIVRGHAAYRLDMPGTPFRFEELERLDGL